MTALPPALARFAGDLERAVRRDIAARRQRRRAIRIGALSAITAGAVLGVLSVLPAHAPSVVDRAAAALQPSGSTIVHLLLRGEQRNPDGSVVTWHSESWQLRSAPYTRRQIEVGPNGIRAETLTSDGSAQLYDAGTNTIYVGSAEPEAPALPRPKLLGAGPRPGTVRVLVTKYRFTPDGSVRMVRGVAVVNERVAKRMLERSDDAQRAQESSGPVEEPFRQQILKLLESGRAREAGRVEVGDREAIRIESADGRRVYLVDAETYAPVEWTSTGTQGSATLRFPVYEELQVDSDSIRFLDLAAQHPGAKVERNPDAYRAAEARLFPNG